MIHRLLCWLGIHHYQGPERFCHDLPFDHETCRACGKVKWLTVPSERGAS